MPPVGQNEISANGPANPFNKLMPPTATAGNNFRKLKPSAFAFITSLPVETPGSKGRSTSLHVCPISKV